VWPDETVFFGFGYEGREPKWGMRRVFSGAVFRVFGDGGGGL
jgi:hypothetical protein